MISGLDSMRVTNPNNDGMDEDVEEETKDGHLRAKKKMSDKQNEEENQQLLTKAVVEELQERLDDLAAEPLFPTSYKEELNVSSVSPLAICYSCPCVANANSCKVFA